MQFSRSMNVPGAILWLCTIAFYSCNTEQPSVDSDHAQPQIRHANFTLTCSECHEKSRPAAPHVQTGDCGGCHKPSDAGGGWQPGSSTSTSTQTGNTTQPNNTASFSHEPPPTSCEGCHAKDRPAAPHVQKGDCVGCHKFPKWKS